MKPNTIPRNAYRITAYYTPNGQAELVEITKDQNGYTMNRNGELFRIFPDYLRNGDFFQFVKIETQEEHEAAEVKKILNDETAAGIIAEILPRISKEYNLLYDGVKKENPFQVELFECYMKVFPFFRRFTSAAAIKRKDAFTSDRELNAFMNVVDGLGLIEYLKQ